jgi:hypothetical protein
VWQGVESQINVIYVPFESSGGILSLLGRVIILRKEIIITGC